MTLYTQVAANKAKTGIYLIFYVVLILVISYVADLYFGTNIIFLIASVVCIVQGVVAYWYADSIALSLAHATLLDQNVYSGVYRIVQNLCVTAGLPMPRLFLIPDTAMNAFATGRDPQHAALALTQGLLERLNENELTGVLAHELSHIGDDDIRLSSMVMIMAGLISLLSDLVLRSMFWGGGRRRNNDNNDEGGTVLFVVPIVLAILAPIAATLIQLAISRKREFMADAKGVLLTRYPEGLISALQKISGDEEPLEAASNATAHMYFTNPLKSKAWFSSFFSTHPPIEERIQALRKGSGLG